MRWKGQTESGSHFLITQASATPNNNITTHRIIEAATSPRMKLSSQPCHTFHSTHRYKQLRTPSSSQPRRPLSLLRISTSRHLQRAPEGKPYITFPYRYPSSSTDVLTQFYSQGRPHQGHEALVQRRTPRLASAALSPLRPRLPNLPRALL